MNAVVLAVACGALAGCAAGGVQPNAPQTAFARERPARAKGIPQIQHIVVIVQENRSVDNLFHGFPGANTVDSGDAHGKKVALRPLSLAQPIDVNHSHQQFLEDYDGGRNDGFDRLIVDYKKKCNDPDNQPKCWVFGTGFYRRLAYTYVPRAQVEPYWFMASHYAFSDETFASNNGPSYTSHQIVIAGQSHHVVENPQYPPWGCDSPAVDTTLVLHYGTSKPPAFSPATGIEVPGPLPCFSYATIADLLDARDISWSYYAPAIGSNRGEVWSAFDAIWPVRFGPDWYANVKSPETRIFNDVAAGDLAQVSWVVPSFVNSDHATSDSLTGPQWVAAVVNAIGKSSYWSSTAIVVFWDDWGGWYDHVVPPQIPDRQTRAYEGLGYRVPLIVISPYAKRGYISHHEHEIASSLHFIEQVFHLPSLGNDDARANSLDDLFDFSQRPATFTPIPAKLGPSYFLHQPPSNRPPDY